MKYMIFDANKINVDTSDMRKSLDGTKVVYHENLTGEENIQQYTHKEILEILNTPEWTEEVVVQVEYAPIPSEYEILRDYVLDLDFRMIMLEFGL